MSDPSSIIVGLETGTSKVCAVVGELSEEGALNIVGLGQARSRGVRKGEIADAATAEEDVRQSIARIKASPFIPHTDAIRGFVFDVATGKLNEVS